MDLPDATIDELADIAYQEAMNRAVVLSVEEVDTGRKEAEGRLGRFLKRYFLENIELDISGSLMGSQVRMPETQEMNPYTMWKQVEITPEDYEWRLTGLSFSTFNPRPEWFSSDAELDEISSKFEEIHEYYSLDTFMDQFKNNSFDGKIWALMNLTEMVYYYLGDMNRGYTEVLSEDQLFESLQEAFLNGEEIEMGNCGDFSYLLTKAGQQLGLDICETNANFRDNLGGHAYNLIKNPDGGWVIIDGTIEQEFFYIPSDNRELAEKIYQQQKQSVKFTSKLYQADKGAIFLGLTDEGQMVADAWEYDESTDNFKDSILRRKREVPSTGIDAEISNQHLSVKANAANFFVKGGYIKGDELSAMDLSKFFLGGIEHKGRHWQGNVAFGVLDLNTTGDDTTDGILTYSLFLNPKVRLAENYTIIPSAGLERIRGGVGGNLAYVVFDSNYYLGLGDELDFSNLTLNNYVFHRWKKNSEAYNHQFPFVLIPYSLHAGQRYSFDSDDVTFSLNPEFFISTPEIGGSLSAELDFYGRAGMQLNGLYAKSRQQPFIADRFEVSGELNVQPKEGILLYLQGDYSAELWENDPAFDMSASIGTRINF